MLQNAYAQAGGNGLTVAGRAEPNTPGLLSDRSNLFGPSGFPPEVVSLLKTRSLESMAKADHPSAQPFIADIAQRPLDPKTSTSVDRDVRLAAVAAMKEFRQPNSAVVLAGVMTMEANRDTAIANRAHEGLISLTGHRYPMTSTEWGQVISADMKIVDEPNAIQRAAAWVIPQ
jgi:hypothetical protein